MMRTAQPNVPQKVTRPVRSAPPSAGAGGTVPLGLFLVLLNES